MFVLGGSGGCGGQGVWVLEEEGMGNVGMVAAVGGQVWEDVMVLVVVFGRGRVMVVMDLAIVVLGQGVLVWVGAMARRDVLEFVLLETCGLVPVVGLFGVMGVF